MQNDQDQDQNQITQPQAGAGGVFVDPMGGAGLASDVTQESLATQPTKEPEPLRLNEFGVPTGATASFGESSATGSKGVVGSVGSQMERDQAGGELGRGFLGEVNVASGASLGNEPEPEVARANAQSPTGEELPLVFAGAVGASSGVSSSQADNPYSPPVMSDYAQSPAPLPPIAPEETSKRGFSFGKVFVLVGILVLVVAILVGAWYAYVQYAGEDARIASVESMTKEQCNGCYNGGWLVWRDGRCRVTGICNSGVPGKDTPNPNPTATPTPPKPSCDKNGVCDCGSNSGYAYCGGCVNACVSMGDLAPYGGCRDYVAAKCDSAPVVGTSCTKTKDTPGFFKACDCSGDGTEDTWFNTTGICKLDPKYGTGAVDNYLCAYADQFGCVGDGDVPVIPKEGGGSLPCWSCNENGCSVVNNANCTSCYVHKHTCNANDNMSKGCNTTNPVIGKSQSFDGKCGQTQQIDIVCGSQTIGFKSKIYPDCTKTNPSPTPAPSLVCTSLTKDKPDANISIGTKITFTCAGSISPAGATSLTYKFRYSVNSGAWRVLTNKTATTAELTPDACGTYSVQCQACGMIDGRQVCDPVWTAATVR